MQNPTGGFGGGHGQLSHAASAYAAVLAMASCGDEESFKLVDRKALWVHRPFCNNQEHRLTTIT